MRPGRQERVLGRRDIAPARGNYRGWPGLWVRARTITWGGYPPAKPESAW